MIRHGETAVIYNGGVAYAPPALSNGPLAQLRAETAIAYFATAAREHPAAKRSAFRRRVWRDDQSLGDRIHAASAARRLNTAQTAILLADLRDGITP